MPFPPKRYKWLLLRPLACVCSWFCKKICYGGAHMSFAFSTFAFLGNNCAFLGRRRIISRNSTNSSRLFSLLDSLKLVSKFFLNEFSQSRTCLVSTNLAESGLHFTVHKIPCELYCSEACI